MDNPINETPSLYKDEEFKNLYTEILLPQIKQCGSLLSKTSRLKRTVHIYRYVVPTTVLLWILPLGYSDFRAILLLICSAAILFHYFPVLGYYRIQKKYWNEEASKYYKFKVIKPLLKYLNTNIEYLPQQRFTLKTLIESRLIYPQPKDRIGEDYIKANIEGTIIQFCNIETYSKERLPLTKPNFQGVIATMTFGKQFEGKTLVLSRRLKSDKTYIFHLRNFQQQFEEVQLESTEFEKEFVVFSTDQIEARYILTTSLMQRILSFQKSNGYTVAFSFAERKAFVKIPLKENMFSYNFKDNFVTLQQIIKEVDFYQFVTRVVNELNLNKEIWTTASRKTSNN